MLNTITSLNGPVEIFSFISLTCTICPDVVQALNIITLLNPSFTNRIIDGAVAPQMIKDYNVNGVPVVYANGELLNVGQATLGELVTKLEQKFGKTVTSESFDGTPLGFDVLIAGGGPAGAAASVYLARKGMKVGVVAGRIGGQVKDTSEIENLISVPITTGTALGAELGSLLASFSNVSIHLSSAVKEIKGNGKNVSSIEVTDRASGEVKDYPVEGVFVQIGLTPNSKTFSEELEINKAGEIVTDSFCRTKIAGVYAAGDVTDVPYKQIVIAMGEGAKAALSASDDRMRGIIPS
ncbi:MAG: FAD-dependent oxidoreductase [Muribaculaceae bacterium]|nr:FAD-dependent oxidoreductase [Muribaculaceae bacterium]